MNSIATQEVGTVAKHVRTLEGQSMPLELQIYFDDEVYQRMEKISLRMSKAEGVTPGHLIGKPEACFFVCEAAVGWGLRPGAVARATYMTPGGQLGFHGSLINAILEKSGRLEPGSGGVRWEHFGDWKHVEGKHEIKTSDKGGKYAAATWTDADAAKGGCGVTVRARLRGEQKDREFTMQLTQAFPRNSTLWATDPKTQIVYLATRRFASLCVPSAMMGFRDPIDDAPSTEVDMGAADVVIPEPAPQIQMPRPAVKAEREEAVDKDTGEITREREPGADEPEQQPGERPPGLITQRALSVLNAQLADKELTESFCKHFGLADPCELPMSKFNAAQEWIKKQK